MIDWYMKLGNTDLYDQKIFVGNTNKETIIYGVVGTSGVFYYRLHISATGTLSFANSYGNGSWKTPASYSYTVYNIG